MTPRKVIGFQFVKLFLIIRTGVITSKLFSKSSFQTKDAIKRMKKQATDWERQFQNIHLITDLYPKYTENF